MGRVTDVIGIAPIPTRSLYPRLGHEKNRDQGIFHPGVIFLILCLPPSIISEILVPPPPGVWEFAHMLRSSHTPFHQNVEIA